MTTERARRKPGPKPKEPTQLEGRDYYCGTCTGHRTIPCEYCFDGCPDCKGEGRVRCPECKGGTVPVPPPTW